MYLDDKEYHKLERSPESVHTVTPAHTINHHIETFRQEQVQWMYLTFSLRVPIEEFKGQKIILIA